MLQDGNDFIEGIRSLPPADWGLNSSFRKSNWKSEGRQTSAGARAPRATFTFRLVEVEAKICGIYSSVPASRLPMPAAQSHT